MHQIARRASALRACAALFLMAATLAGCSDGGGGGSATPAPPATTPADFWLSAISNAGTRQDTLLVIDPDQPNSPRLSVDVDDHLPGSAFSFDAASGTFTYRGASMVYFVSNHLLYQVSLRKTGATVAQRISSLATACRIADWHPLRFDGSDDAWLEVLEAGADGDCDQAADNGTVFVRTGTPASTAASALPAGVDLIGELPQVAGTSTSVFLMRDSRGATSKLALYDAALAPIGDISGGAGLSTLELLNGIPALPDGTSSAYARSGTSLRRLTWTPTSASLSPSLYTFDHAAPADSALTAYADAAGTYFVDGLKIKRITAANVVSTVASFDPGGGESLALLQASPSHLVLAQSSTTGGTPTTLLALSLTGGGSLAVLASTADFYTAGRLTGGDVMYATRSDATRELAMHRVDIQGHNDRLVARGVDYPLLGGGRNLNSNALPFAVDTLSWCEKADAEPDCRKGTLKSYDQASGITTILGTFTHTAAVFYVNDSFFGEPMVLLAYAYDPATLTWRKDVYLARPGQAGSLTRVTHHIP